MPAAALAPADRVFGFVGESRDLPRYLPTVHESEAEPGERMRLEGDGARGQYASDDYRHVLNDQHGMAWGADRSNRYPGWIGVEREGRDRNRCTLTVQLSFDEPATHAARGRSGRERTH